VNESGNRIAVPSPHLEQNPSHAPVVAEEAQGLDSRVDIRVISYRKRKHDPDGISVKAVLDGIVRAGLLPDDSTEQVRRITFESIKTKEDEKTVIILEAA